ncbi:6-bladed beta-propeller [Bacteroidota bacterium]
MKTNIWINISLLLLIKLLFVSCSTNITKQTPNEVVIFPSPPDPARIQYLTKFSSSLDITGKRSSLMDYVAGEEKGDPVIKPYGIKVHKGKIYICDTILRGLEIIDLENKSFRYFQPKGFGTIKKPINVEVDDKGNIFVADSERREIIVFDNQLNFKTSFGNPDKLKPTDVFYYKNKLWVSNIATHQIEVYSAENYDHLYDIPEYDTEDEGFLNSPVNIFLQNDTLYVCDFGAAKVKLFTMDGTFIRSVGSYGRNLGQFVRPKGIAVDRDNLLYVVDAAFENIQMFNSSGNLLMFFGGTYKGPGYMWLPAKVTIDYDNLEYFEQYVNERFDLKYLIFVTNQYGPDKISVYGFIDKKK